MVVDAHRRGHVLPHDHGHLVRPEKRGNKNPAEHLFERVPSSLEVVLDEVGGVGHAQVVTHHPPDVRQGLEFAPCCVPKKEHIRTFQVFSIYFNCDQYGSETTCM